MLTKVGTSATNGQGGFASVNSSAPYDLTDCDTFSVMIYGGPWVGTIQFEGSLDRSNWFPITMHSINGTITPSTTTNINGLFFKPSVPGLVACRINMTAYTSGSLSFLIVGHRLRHVDYTDFWTTAMPFTRDAVFAIDASRSSVGETVVVNSGSGGTALNATYGSTGGADSNDPLLLPWTGTNYLWCDTGAGASANFLQATVTPTTLVGTGTLEWRCKAFADGISGELMGTSATFLFGLYLSAGNLALGLTIAGTNRFINLGAVPTGQVVTYRATFDPVSGNAIGYYSLNDGATWVTLSTVTWVGALSVFSGSYFLGQIGFGVGGSCRIYTAELITAGTRTFYFNSATDITSGGQTAGTTSFGHTFTISRALAGRKSVAVTRPVWLFGTDDYMEVLDNALLNMNASQSFTVLAVVRQWATPTSFGRYIDKSNSGDTGWSVESTAGLAVYGSVDDGPNAVSCNGLSTFAAGSLIAIGLVADRVGQTLATFSSSTLSATASISAVGTLSNALPMRIGSNAFSTGGSFQDFELLAVAVFRRALSATEIGTIGTYYGTV